MKIIFEKNDEKEFREIGQAFVKALYVLIFAMLGIVNMFLFAVAVYTGATTNMLDERFMIIILSALVCNTILSFLTASQSAKAKFKRR
jgi:TctA family transporter